MWVPHARRCRAAGRLPGKPTLPYTSVPIELAPDFSSTGQEIDLAFDNKIFADIMRCQYASQT